MRKNGRLFKFKSFFMLAVAMLLTALCCTTDFGVNKTVYAGKAGGYIVVDSMLFSSDTINTSNWRYKGNQGIKMIKRLDSTRVVKFGGTLQEEGYIYDVGNALISRKFAYVAEEDDKFEAEFSLKIIKTDVGKRFGFVFGLSGLVENVGSDGSYFLYFKKNNMLNYQYGLSSFSGGVENEILQPTDLADTGVNTGIGGDDFDVSVSTLPSGLIEIEINGGNVYSGTVSDSDFSGYFGFTQDGELSSPTKMVNVELSHISVFNVHYSRPFAPLSFSENFNDNGYDKNYWYFNGTNGLFVQDGKFHFDTATEGCYIGTRYQYSNFDLSFTMSGSLNKPHDGLGSTYRPSVSFGNSVNVQDLKLSDALVKGVIVAFDAPVNAIGERTGATQLIITENGQEQTPVLLDERFDFLRWEDEQKEIGVNIAVTDGNLKIGMKLDDDADYTEVCSYSLNYGLSPEGAICFWARKHPYGVNGMRVWQYSDYSFDDFVIKNTDDMPNSVDVDERLSSYASPSVDYAYSDSWSKSDIIGASNIAERNSIVFNEDDTENKGCSSDVRASFSVAVLLLVGTVLINAKRGYRYGKK